MPTYLVSVVISELECRENDAKNFSVCYRPSARDQSGYFFEMGQRVQQAYDVLFDYKYNNHMKKLTIAAIPQLDPGIGGMENWGKHLDFTSSLMILKIVMHFNRSKLGLVTCQEFKLLIDPKLWTMEKQENLAKLNTHEVGHMWWGDIVTVAWWDNFWLKEGFAQYFAFLGTNVVCITVSTI